MINPSPLRYPGGKNRLAPLFAMIIKQLNIQSGTYIEPFAGGAGVALSLLLNGVVKNIVINDYDKAIYSFWRAVKQEPAALIKKIENTPITIDEWHKQKAVYSSSVSYSLDLAFATLFLNRTNRSGILSAGPIGGYSQSGKWRLDVRFKKEAIIEKIYSIAKFRKNITVYNKDIICLLRKYSQRFGNNTFYYFDPPYYNKGQKLYKNFFSHEDHKRIHDIIKGEIVAPWVVTYDDTKEISCLYEGHVMRRFDLTYSAANKGMASELMFFSDGRCCPTQEHLRENGIMINLRK